MAAHDRPALAFTVIPVRPLSTHTGNFFRLTKAVRHHRGALFALSLLLVQFSQPTSMGDSCNSVKQARSGDQLLLCHPQFPEYSSKR